MKISANFSQRVIVHSSELPWVASPMAGVERRALDRVGSEVARATTIVRYAPGSKFSPHIHTGGEEFIVLEGTFQDEHGDYPTGSYVRNPPQSSHTPRSDEGCIILVKLWQFQPEDRTHVCIQMNAIGKEQKDKNSGVQTTSLYKDHIEEVSLLHFVANAKINLNPVGGSEFFVLEGEISEQQDQLKQHSWARLPVDQSINIKAGKNGAKIWMKTGHLSDVANQVERVQENIKQILGIKKPAY